MERTCPAADRQRADRKAARSTATTRQRERARAAELARRSTTGGVDLLEEAKRFARLPALSTLSARRFPEIVIRHTARRERSSGHCWYGGADNGHDRIVVTCGTDPYSPIATMLHEMTHSAYPRAGHSAAFWKMVRQAAREAWPTARFDFAHARDGWQVDRAVRNGLAELDGAATTEEDL